MRVEVDNHPVQDRNLAAKKPRSYFRIYPETNEDMRALEWAIEVAGSKIIKRQVATTGHYLIVLHEPEER